MISFTSTPPSILEQREESRPQESNQNDISVRLSFGGATDAQSKFGDLEPSEEKKSPLPNDDYS